MTEKKKPRRAATHAEQKKNIQYHYTEEFTEKQAEKIFNRDFSRLVCGAVSVLLVLLVLGWCGAI